MPNPTSLPKQSNFTATVADITDKLVNTSGTKTREYRLVTFLDTNNQSIQLPVNEKFFLRNQQRLALDVMLVVTTEECIKGKTHWVDDQGKENPHTYDGTNIKNVVRATTMQGKFAYLGQVENKIVGMEDPTKAMALATLYGNALR